ncbi:efflux transporter outer membrane subunit [Pseudovibrio flavus]|uniref:efflux transporter outer membrane subunit n=1 Tax=Pseudovibrio flavus TaxID=2529854 RepID=UPI0035286CE1
MVRGSAILLLSWMMRAARCSAVGSVVLLTGCMVGPNFTEPNAPPVNGYTPGFFHKTTASAKVHGGGAQVFSSNRDVAGSWWELFHSPSLNRLVEIAVKNNPDLAAAEASLSQARELALAEGGSLFPTLSGTFSAERQKISDEGRLQGANTGFEPVYNIFTASVSVNYVLDVFGGVRRQIEANLAQVEYEEFQVEAAHLSLTANLVNAAIQEASLRGQIAATNEIISARRSLLRILEDQFQLGAVTRAEVLQQQASLANAEATLPPLQLQLEQQRNVIIALAGYYPDQNIVPRFNLDDLKLPHKLPLSLPANLVRQRPDVRAAEAQMWQSSANIGVATANMLPKVQITGNLGSDAAQIDKLFNPGLGAWSIATNLSQVVFDGGSLWHKRKAAIAAYEEARQNYRSAVVTSFQNVSDSIRAVQIDAVRLKAALAAERASKASLVLARQQYKLGAINFNTLLTNEESYQQARLNLVQAQALRYADTVALFQALGGGWWNRPEAAPVRDDIPKFLSVVAGRLPPEKPKQTVAGVANNG